VFDHFVFQRIFRILRHISKRGLRVVSGVSVTLISDEHSRGALKHHPVENRMVGLNDRMNQMMLSIPPEFSPFACAVVIYFRCSNIKDERHAKRGKDQVC